MRPLILAALIAALLPSVAWGPILTTERMVLSLWLESRPRAYVIYQAKQYRVPPALALAVWERESSMAVKVKDGVQNGVSISRGAFQVTRDAAIDVGCVTRWNIMRKFQVSVNCGMRYLAESVKKCESPLRGAHRYFHGSCPRNGKIWSYGQDIGKLMMKHSGKRGRI